MEKRNENTDAYPRPSSTDEQLRNQDEFASQKPNEKSSTNSDLPQPALKEADNSAPGDKDYKDSNDQR